MTRASSSGVGDQMPLPSPSVNRATDSDVSGWGPFFRSLVSRAQTQHCQWPGPSPRSLSYQSSCLCFLSSQTPLSAPQWAKAPHSDLSSFHSDLSGWAPPLDSSTDPQERPYGITKAKTKQKLYFKKFNICRKASMGPSWDKKLNRSDLCTYFVV